MAALLALIRVRVTAGALEVRAMEERLLVAQVHLAVILPTPTARLQLAAKAQHSRLNLLKGTMAHHKGRSSTRKQRQAISHPIAHLLPNLKIRPDRLLLLYPSFAGIYQQAMAPLVDTELLFRLPLGPRQPLHMAHPYHRLHSLHLPSHPNPHPIPHRALHQFIMRLQAYQYRPVPSK